jgi:hypothetical protein
MRNMKNQEDVGKLSQRLKNQSRNQLRRKLKLRSQLRNLRVSIKKRRKQNH